MEIEISPASSFNASHQNVMHGASSQNGLNGGESAAKRFKTDLEFRCIVCSNSYVDPNDLYEHMQSKHPELYEPVRCVEDDTRDDEEQRSMTSDDFGDYCSILEPICELRQYDDEFIDFTQSNPESRDTNDLQSDIQLQLELQLQNHIQNQLHMHSFLQALASQGISEEKANEAIAYVLRSLGLRMLFICAHRFLYSYQLRVYD